MVLTDLQISSEQHTSGPDRAHRAILSEIDAFNHETFAIRAEAEILRPESEAFERFGLELEKVVIEELNPVELATFKKGLAKAQEFRSHFEPRLNALLARQDAHIKHERDLIRRLRALGMLASEQPTPFSRN